MRITVMHDIAANQNPASPAESGKSRKSNWFGELTAIPSQIADIKLPTAPIPERQANAARLKTLRSVNRSLSFVLNAMTLNSN